MPLFLVKKIPSVPLTSPLLSSQASPLLLLYYAKKPPSSKPRLWPRALLHTVVDLSKRLFHQAGLSMQKESKKIKKMFLRIIESSRFKSVGLSGFSQEKLFAPFSGSRCLCRWPSPLFHLRFSRAVTIFIHLCTQLSPTGHVPERLSKCLFN